jgi:hypothetical protein
MFESALIRKHTEGQLSVDAGIIAETLLFYENVHVLADNGVFADLIRVIGPDNLINLLDRKALSLSFTRDVLGVYNNTQNNISVHRFVSFRLAARQNKKRISDADQVELLAENVLGKSRESKRVTRALLDRIRFKNLNECPGLPQGIPAHAQEDVFNPRFLKAAIADILRILIPEIELPQNWTFDIVRVGEEFLVGTNLNFEDINKHYHKRIPPEHSTINADFLLGFVLHAKADAYFAADYMAEIVTSPISSSIIDRSLSQILIKRENNLSQIEMFQKVHLDNGRGVREAINSGERSFADFLQLLERADRFKTWLSDRNPDATLLQEYYTAATSDSWIERLPTKSLRFVFTTLGGAAADLFLPTGGLGTAVGAGLGAVDSLLLDRLLKGWKPNQFVEGELREFTSRK